MPTVYRMTDSKPWWRSKRVGAALISFWGNVGITMSTVIGRCNDCSLWDAFQRVTAAEAWGLISSFVVAWLAIWYGETPVSRPGKVGG